MVRSWASALLQIYLCRAKVLRGLPLFFNDRLKRRWFVVGLQPFYRGQREG